MGVLSFDLCRSSSDTMESLADTEAKPYQQYAAWSGWAEVVCFIYGRDISTARKTNTATGNLFRAAPVVESRRYDRYKRMNGEIGAWFRAGAVKEKSIL